MPLTAEQIRNLTPEQVKAKSVEASQKHHDQMLERYARQHNDVELAKRNGFDLSKPPSWEHENQCQNS